MHTITHPRTIPTAFAATGIALVAGTLALAARATAQAPATGIAFDVKPGTKLERAFVLEQRLAMQGMTFVVDGVAQSSQKSLDLHGRIATTIRDDVRTISGGRATSFARAFDEATLKVDIDYQDSVGQKHTDTIEAGSQLALTSVLFTWVPDEKSYGKCYDAREASEEFLQRLAADADLLAFLPRGEVQPGAEWDVDARAIQALFAPLGDLPWRYTKASEVLPARTVNLGLAGPLADVLAGEVKGRVHARLARVNHAAGVDEAVLELEYDVQVERDQTLLAQTYATPPELYDGARITTAGLRWKSAGKGTLVYDFGLGTFKSVEIAGSEEVRSTTAYSLRGGKSKTEQSIQTAGGLKLTIATRVAPPKSAVPLAPKKGEKPEKDKR